ncbi:MAG TPA: acetyl-CoA carboxylase biotin carboxyl carrier protein [Cytophagales bacterium]|nr:acetyl-CoA carboxylase biotin carboxyl carrier protein [Cytophagales bacterium]
MKAKEIQELLDFIAKTGLEEVNIETEQFKVAVKRSAQTLSVAPQIIAPVAQPQAQSAPPQTQAQAPKAETPKAAEPAAASSNTVAIKSPMIGTFYTSSNPASPVFVNVGDEVKKGQVVCIIEAMKLFNEIESEVSGRIVKVLVQNATPVEYDQPLFLVEPI